MQVLTPVFPSVAAAAAALIGLLWAVLTVQVIRNRVRFNCQAGDGGHAELAQAVRAHANLAENAPLALLRQALAEAGGAQRGIMLGLAGVLVLASLLVGYRLLA